MKDNHKLALIVGYFLSRCDRKGWTSLGYTSIGQAITELSTILDVKPATLRNMRDEFDPYHDNDRIGWVRPMLGTRAKVMQAFQDMDDDGLVEVVKEILQGKSFTDSEAYDDIESVLAEPKDKKRRDPIAYVPRGHTGRAAENLFKEYYGRTKLPVAGNLIDKRDEGCGYDFEIETPNGSRFVEVKGLSAEEGGILLTSKEWATAKREKEKYYLVLIRNIASEAIFETVQDPASRLAPKKSIYTSVQISWSVSGSALKLLRSPQA